MLGFRNQRNHVEIRALDFRSSANVVEFCSERLLGFSVNDESSLDELDARIGVVEGKVFTHMYMCGICLSGACRRSSSSNLDWYMEYEGRLPRLLLYRRLRGRVGGVLDRVGDEFILAWTWSLCCYKNDTQKERKTGESFSVFFVQLGQSCCHFSHYEYLPTQSPQHNIVST